MVAEIWASVMLSFVDQLVALLYFQILSLWERGSVVGVAQRDFASYYVSRLMPPISPHSVSAGTKLKRMSCIPGWDPRDEKRTCLVSNPCLH